MSGPASAGATSPTAAQAAPTSTEGVIVVVAAMISSLMEIEGGELMTVVETTAVRGARIILTSRASS